MQSHAAPGCVISTFPLNRLHGHYLFIKLINRIQRGNVQQHIKVAFFLATFPGFFFLSCFSTVDVVGWGSSQRITLSVWPSCQLSPETWGARLSAQPSAATTRTLCNFNLSGGRGGRNVTGWQFSLPATPSTPFPCSVLVKGPRCRTVHYSEWLFFTLETHQQGWNPLINVNI